MPSSCQWGPYTVKVTAGGFREEVRKGIVLTATQCDAAIFRDFRIYERVSFQFRGEATNVFNFVNLNAPNGTLNSATFGQTTSAASMRQIQVDGRILF